ncbi:unnamed protein product [Urochloa decumbens]|uniref:HMA domain-containing protein n=1 Tax=Urochloa decumbens TaxID=240449 RepID=A0ABC9B2B4_9POAL
MEVITGAMSTLLPKLGDLLMEEYKLQTSVKGDIRFLKAELKAMETALLVISEASLDLSPDSQDKIWAKEVRDLSYDIEDNVDKFMVRIDHAPKKLGGLRGFIDRTLNLKSNHLTKARIRHEIGTDMKEIKTHITEVKERRDRYKVDKVALRPEGKTVDNHYLSVIHKRASELVGAEKKSGELIERLMEGDDASKKQRRIVSVAGFGGLGKTTLAKVVYDKLIGKFDCGAFVSVSHRPNIERIFINMLHQLGVRNIEATWDHEQLIFELKKFLQDKMYFIVIDDIWETSVWETIQFALVDNEYGSKVISTTRDLHVAEEVGTVYRLKPLSRADSRKLFCLRVFGTEEDCIPNALAEVSENILKKCGDVPLAIITIASMIASGKDNTREAWSKVCHILGSGLEDSHDAIVEMRRILYISYYHLPHHLKACMLYLSSYQEDACIWTEQLIWKWVGEGFIKGQQEESFYDVGEHYVAELINRGMVDPPLDINHDCDKTAYFRVHDMVLDLITRLSNEDDFLTTLDGQRPIHLPEKIRRLSIRSSKEEHVRKLSIKHLEHVRSLFVSLEAFHFLPDLFTFPVLRLLDLSGCEQVGNQYFRCICNLFHLRYLRLSHTSITEIPKEIKNLHCLQFLDVSRTEVTKLPSTFDQLRQLLYLRVSTLTRTPDGFGNLKQLEALDGTIIVDSPTMLHNLTGLSKLRRMDLQFDEWDESYEELFIECLGSLGGLEYLNLSGCNGDFGSRCDKVTPGPQLLQNINMKSSTICAVPRWMSSLCALTILHIYLSTLGEEDLHVLGSIPSLSDLQLSVEESTQGCNKKIVIDNAYSFLCLKKFEICKTIGVVFAHGAMPKLQTLVLLFGVLETLDKFGDFDFGLENLSSLMHVDAWMGCSKAKSEKLQAAKESIQNALDMNPNKPTLNCKETDLLKMHIQFKGCQSAVTKILTEIDGVSEENIQLKQGKLTVSGQVDPTTVIDKLNKAGMLAQLLSYRWEQPWYFHYPYPPPYYVVHSAEEDPNSCSVM